MTERPGGSLPAVLSLELTACRQRGIERLDVHTHSQSPVPRPELQRLADEYQAATGGNTTNRIAQLAGRLADAAAARAPDFSSVAAELAELEEDTRQSWAGYEGEAELAGLPGLQFREFFTLLLSYYERAGRPGRHPAAAPVPGPAGDLPTAGRRPRSGRPAVVS